MGSWVKEIEGQKEEKKERIRYMYLNTLGIWVDGVRDLLKQICQ